MKHFRNQVLIPKPRDACAAVSSLSAGEVPVVSAPHAISPSAHEQALLRQLLAWQEASALSPIVLGVPLVS